MVKILNNTEINTGISRYIKAIPNSEIYSLVFNRYKEYLGIKIKPKIDLFYIPKIYFPKIIFNMKNLENEILLYASQFTPIISNDLSIQYGIIHDIMPLKYENKIIQFYILKQLEKMREFKKIICVSNYVKNQLIDRFNFDKNKIEVIYPYISSIFDVYKRFTERELKLNDKIKIRKTIDLPIDKKIILNVANGNKNKGLDEIPLILDHLPNDFILIHIGDNNIIHNRVINVHNINDFQLTLFYLASDLFLNTSNDEGFNIPNIEAQFFGLPVIAKKLIVFDEVLKDSYIPFITLCNIGSNEYYREWSILIQFTYENKEKYYQKSIENALRFNYNNFYDNWINFEKREGLI